MLTGRPDTAAVLGIAVHRVAGIGSWVDYYIRLIHDTTISRESVPLTKSKTYRCCNWVPLSQCRARSRLGARRCIAAAGYTCSVLAAAAAVESGRARSTVVEPCRCSWTWMGRGKGVCVCVGRSRDVQPQCLAEEGLRNHRPLCFYEASLSARLER